MFGFRVVAFGNELAVGAHFNSSASKRAGAVYRFSNENGIWVENDLLTLPDGRSDDRFGIALALGKAGLIVGAERADVVGADSGAIFIYGNN